MKKYLFLAAVTLFYTLFTSCTADKAQPKVNSELSDIITSGTWKVTHYSDHGDIETSHFYDYTFTFTTDGRIVANDGQTPVNGLWNVTTNNDSPFYTDISSSSDDTPNDTFDFNIAFSSPLDFNDIQDDWDVVSKSENVIVLIDGNQDDPTRTDYLTFEKIRPFELRTVLLDGTWEVAHYSDRGDNETINFAGYLFTFNADGTVLANLNNVPVSGNWSITTAHNSPLYTAPATADDSPTDPVDFNLMFPMPPNSFLFNDIEDDWDVAFVSDSTIMLKDVVAANRLLDDYLVLRKKQN
jgi:hypothetical protein